jgi:putative ATP-dependent endonuclease of the OLD family
MPGIPISIRIRNYKCFGDEAQGFETVKPINVIAGRNNSGKSALLDVIQQACSGAANFRIADAPAGKTPSIVFAAAIPEQVARTTFPQNQTGGHIPAGNHWATAGRHYVGVRVSWQVPNGRKRDGRQLLSVSEDFSRFFSGDHPRATLEQRLVMAMPDPIEGRLFRRLAAERDVGPEPESDQLDPQSSGRNVTNLIQSYANVAKYDRGVIDDVLLTALNSITAPDYSFKAIVPRKHDNGTWEIFLEEAEKGLVALSASGSGLKTILCVLAHIAIWPIANGKKLNQCVFAFEELENSLHPALLRRLLQYIRRRIKGEDGCIFLTTHSATAIDMFASDEQAQIIHTSHRAGEAATAITISEYLHRRTVLDDLDIRASDLLQANGIVWVEGPSDRTIVNRWISLASGDTLREGTHYQCVFYGGKLLAHLSLDDPAEDQSLVSVLRVNRNAAVLIDSDRSQAQDTLNATKQRILAEITSMGGFEWVTAGREIENYLPTGVIAVAAALPESAHPLGQYQDVAEYLDSRSEGAGKRFERSKAEFAARAVSDLTLAAQSAQYDWRTKIDELCACIRTWNRIAPPVGP